MAASEKLNPSAEEWGTKTGECNPLPILSPHPPIPCWCLTMAKPRAPWWGPFGSASTEQGGEKWAGRGGVNGENPGHPWTLQRVYAHTIIPNLQSFFSRFILQKTRSFQKTKLRPTGKFEIGPCISSCCGKGHLNIWGPPVLWSWLHSYITALLPFLIL